MPILVTKVAFHKLWDFARTVTMVRHRSKDSIEELGTSWIGTYLLGSGNLAWLGQSYKGTGPFLNLFSIQRRVNIGR